VYSKRESESFRQKYSYWASKYSLPRELRPS
jgi:hypothetical protein